MSSNQSVKKKRPYVKPSICVIQGEEGHLMAGSPETTVNMTGVGAGTAEQEELTSNGAKPAYPSAYELFHSYDSAYVKSRHRGLWDD